MKFFRENKFELEFDIRSNEEKYDFENIYIKIIPYTIDETGKAISIYKSNIDITKKNLYKLDMDNNGKIIEKKFNYR